MKRLLLLTALVLSGFMASARDAAEPSGPQIGFTITPRLDVSPCFSTQSDGDNSFSFGSSSLYTLFEGDIDEHWSFLVVNHWLSNDPSAAGLFAGTKGLYDGTLRTDSGSWLDYFNATYSTGGFSFTLGKDMTVTGGFEYEPWDFEVHPAQMSGLWNSLSCYQWGGKVSWTTPSENTTFGVQMTTSPYSDEDCPDSYRPFRSGRFNYSLFWLGEFDLLRTNVSLTSLQRCDWSYSYLAAAGVQLTPGQFTVEADWFNKVGRYDAEDFLAKGHTGILALTYTLPSEKFSFTLKGCYEKTGEPDEEAGIYDNWFTGLTAGWYPVQGDTNLRVHGAVSYDHICRQISVTVGALFNFYISLTGRR